MAGGYPCCCPAAGSGSSAGICDCCKRHRTPNSWTVTIAGVENATVPFPPLCSDCDLLNGVYVLDRVFDASGFGCDWTVLFDPVCGYDRLTLAILCFPIDQNDPSGPQYWDMILTFTGTFSSSFLVFKENGTDDNSDGLIGAVECGECHSFSDKVDFFSGGYCRLTNASATACPTGESDCCGIDMPTASVSTCIATITGTSGCPGGLHPVDGDQPMTYFGTGAVNPCGGTPAQGFVAGYMKWFSDSSTYILRVFCQETDILVEFLYYTCNIGGTLGGVVIWSGTAALGSCNFEGLVLTLESESTEGAPCVDLGSTVTLHDFVL